jgi:hypothetical protein
MTIPQQPTTAPTIAQQVMTRLDKIDARVAKLADLATFLATPLEPGEPNYFENLTALLGSLVSGMEAAHSSLHELHARLQEPGIARAIERAIKDP